jgi:hypothetical protein
LDGRWAGRSHAGGVTRFASHIAIAAAALVAGGFGATAFSSPESSREGAAVPTLTAPPEQVRTVVVTKTIHRVRHVRVHHKAAPVAAPAAAPPPVAVAPARPRYVPVAAPRPVVAPATHPLKTRTSGGSGTGEHEHDGGDHEGGGDD